jgi:transketolase
MAAVTMRNSFIDATDRILSERNDVAVVLADIGVSQFRAAGVIERHPERILNVGIREQLQVSFAAGLAKEGIRPIVHTYAPFLVERPFEQIKLDFGHQGMTGVFVSVGASYDSTVSGRTHQAPEDVALMSTLPGWQIHVPGPAEEAERILHDAMNAAESVYIRLSDESNAAARAISNGRMVVERRGTEGAPVVVAVGPKLDAILDAVSDMDVTVLYATTMRPFDQQTLRQFVGTDVILVEPCLAGTSSAEISNALVDRPHRLLSLGVKRKELRNYGSIADHNKAYGLDAAGLRMSISEFLG